MSVNLSARQLQRADLVDTVAAAVADAGIEPSSLCLEVTESVMMQRTEAAMGTLHALRALGVRVGIDDFGTGYSSLAYLRSFRLDVLKLDRSFISELSGDRDASAIVAVIKRMADALELTAIAEGVETAPQRRELRALGWQLAQGFHFARPQPAAAISAALVEGFVLPVRKTPRRAGALAQASMLSA